MQSIKSLSMSKSWKTSLFGIVGSVLVGCSEAPGIPPWLAHVLLKLAIAAPALGLLFARDNNKTSEQVGAGAQNNGVSKPNS